MYFASTPALFNEVRSASADFAVAVNEAAWEAATFDTDASTRTESGVTFTVPSPFTLTYRGDAPALSPFTFAEERTAIIEIIEVVMIARAMRPAALAR